MWFGDKVQLLMKFIEFERYVMTGFVTILELLEVIQLPRSSILNECRYQTGTNS